MSMNIVIYTTIQIIFIISYIHSTYIHSFIVFMITFYNVLLFEHTNGYSWPVFTSYTFWNCAPAASKHSSLVAGAQLQSAKEARFLK